MKKLLIIGMTLSLATVMLMGCGDKESAPAATAPAPATKAPVAATKAPVAATETPAMATETPAMATETPAMATEKTAETGADAPAASGNTALENVAPGAIEADIAAITAETLVGKSFTLVSVNGEKFSGEQVPTLAFGADMAVSGQVCNRFNGSGELVDGLLKVGPLAATRMACPPGPLGQLEQDIFVLLGSPVVVSLDGSVLTLNQGDTTLVYEIVVAPSEV